MADDGSGTVIVSGSLQAGCRSLCSLSDGCGRHRRGEDGSGQVGEGKGDAGIVTPQPICDEEEEEEEERQRETTTVYSSVTSNM